jgi:hypothetical protein
MTSKASRLRERLTIDPDNPSVLQGPTPTPDTPTVEDRPSEASKQLPEGKTVTSVLGRSGSARNGGGEAMATALDDPTLLAGRKAYRSFYVDDLAFGRFRAAVYWVARRPDAAGEVPENMSVAINDAMIDLATKLEQQFNEGNIFPPTPEQRKSKRTKSS